jgi:TolA-binding protein
VGRPADVALAPPRRGRAALALLLLALAMGWWPLAWGGEGEEKQPLKLPEVVIVGQDVSILKEAKERLVPQEVAQTLKAVPGEARERIDLSSLETGGRAAPQVTSPGCLFGNPVTGSIARAFLGDEAQYKVGLYRYQTGDYRGAIEAFASLHRQYPQSVYRGSAYYWEGESYEQLGQPELALAALRQVIQSFPGERLRDYALLSAATIHLRQQQPAEAVPLLRELLTQYPSSPIADQGRLYLGEALFRAGRYAEAADAYAQLLTARNGEAYRATALFWRAESLFQQGELERAEQGYREFMGAYPRHPRAEDALYGLGWTELSLQKYRSALDTFQRLEQSFPRTRFRESLLYGRIKAHLALRQLPNAQDVYRQLTREFPTSRWFGVATLEFARVAYQAGDHATAARLSKQLVDAAAQRQLAPVARVLQGDILYQEGRFAEAIEAYQRAERDGLPGDLLETVLLKRALAAYQRRDFAAAAADLERLLQQFPTSASRAEAAFWLGEARFYNRQYRQALQAYQRVPPDSPRYPDALYGIGWVHYQGSDWPKAAAEFEHVVAKYPEAPIRPEALYRLGEVYYNLKDFARAVASYQQLVRDYPDDKLAPQARFRIGWVRYKTGDFDQAIRQLSGVVRAYPSHPIAAEAHYWLGMAYLGAKQFDQARAAFEAVLAANPTPDLSAQALLRLGDAYYNQGQFEPAIDAYRRVAERTPADAYTPDAEYGIVLALYQLRRFDEYRTRARAFVERYPKHPLGATVLYQLAELFEAEKRPQRALEVYQEVLSRFGGSDLADAAHLRRGEILAGQGDWRAALAEYQQAVAVAKSEAVRIDALYGMAKAQRELKHYEAAAQTFRRLALELPEHRLTVAGLRGLAQVLTQAGRSAEAKAIWQTLLERAPKDPAAGEARVELGLLLQAEGNYPGALEQFHRALAQGTPEIAARAQYEIGRTYSLQKNYQQGTLELMKVAYLYPQQQRWVQRALFQAAANYEQEQKWREALAIYQKIVNEASGPESREQASHKLEQLKKKLNAGRDPRG